MCVFFRLGTIVCSIQNFHSKQCYLFIVGFYCHSVPKYQCVHELSNFVDCCCADDVVFLALVSVACSVWCCCHFRQISMMAFVLHIFFFAFLFFFHAISFLLLLIPSLDLLVHFTTFSKERAYFMNFICRLYFYYMNSMRLGKHMAASSSFIGKKGLAY